MNCDVIFKIWVHMRSKFKTNKNSLSCVSYLLKFNLDDILWRLQFFISLIIRQWEVACRFKTIWKCHTYFNELLESFFEKARVHIILSVRHPSRDRDSRETQVCILILASKGNLWSLFIFRPNRSSFKIWSLLSGWHNQISSKKIKKNDSSICIVIHFPIRC